MGDIAGFNRNIRGRIEPPHFVSAGTRKLETKRIRHVHISRGKKNQKSGTHRLSSTVARRSIWSQAYPTCVYCTRLPGCPNTFEYSTYLRNSNNWTSFFFVRLKEKKNTKFYQILALALTEIQWSCDALPVLRAGERPQRQAQSPIIRVLTGIQGSPAMRRL